MKKKPNIMLFFTDDQRYDTIRALGNSQIHTPNLDALVARGTTFTHAHIPGGTCAAVCMPSRAMLHSGRTLFHIDRMGTTIPPEHTTLGESLRAAGYETFGVGKWHNGRTAYARSFSGGGEIFFGGMGDHWNVPAYHFDPAGRYDRKCAHVADPFCSNTTAFRECDHIEAGKHSTDLFVEASLGCLARRKRPDPFFMYVSLMAPHDPRTMPAKYLKMYDPASIKLPPNFRAQHPFDTGALRVRDELLAAIPRVPDEIKRHIAEYYAMISHLDDGFGRIIAALRESGELDNTLVVFAGDNGLALGQHGLMGKQSLYDHSLRVPLVMAGPGIPAGQRRDALVYLLDIFPTLCDLAGIETPASVEGQSFAPCLENAGASIREALLLAYGNSIRGFTDGRRKLIEYACGATQLFDLADDPHERNDLAGNHSAKETVAAMRGKLRNMAVEWEDTRDPTGIQFYARRPDLQ